jgi:hypothetical protein
MSTHISSPTNSAQRGIAFSTRRDWLNRYATVWTVLTFAVSAVTGVFIFFHLGNTYLMGLHEWLSMGFVIAAVLHVLRHSRVFMTLVSKSRTRYGAVVIVLVSIAFVGTAALSPSRGNPMKAFVDVSRQAPVSAVAQVIGLSPDDLRARFDQAGVSDVRVDQSIDAIAARSGIDARRLYAIALGKD